MDFDRWYRSEFRTSPSSVHFIRVLFALYVLLVGAHDFSWIAGLPSDLFHPPLGLMSLFSGFPSEWFLTSLRFLVVASAWGLLIGWRIVPCALTLGLCFLLSYGSAYSVGKITHNILYVLSPFALAFLFRKSSKSAGLPDTEAQWRALSLLALVLGFLMLTAALPKVVFGWLNPASSAVYAYSLEAQILRAPMAPNWLLRTIPWEGLDWITLLFELAFLPCAFRASWFRLLCAIACVFHFMVLLTLDISFASNIAAYAIFFDWTAVSSRLKSYGIVQSICALGQRARAWHGLVVAAGYVWFIDSPPLNFVAQGIGLDTKVAVFATAGDLLVLFAGALLGAAYIAQRSSRLIRFRG